MAMELRKTGINVIGDVPWGTHFCHFYETKEDLLDTLIPYFKTGLENNEFCVWVVSDPLGEEEARNGFSEAVPEADRYLAAGHIEIVPHTIFPFSRQKTSPAGHIEIVPHTEWYLKGGAFIAQRVIDAWNQKLADALAKGYGGLRANGNEAWLTDENRNDFIQYEKTLDEKLADQRMIVLCSYPLSSSSAAQLFDVVNAHQLAVIRRRGNWEVLETPELMQAKQAIKRLNDELEQRVVERTEQLAAANEKLRKEIAERKQAEEALRQSEDHLRLVIDTIPTMAWSIWPDGAVDFVNQRWLDYTGLSLEEEIEAPTRPMHPEDLARAMEKWHANRAAGEASEDEIRLRRADGEYRWFLVRTAPLRDEQGNVVKWYGVSIDIEDRKRAEEELKQRESQLADAQRLAHVGSWEWDIVANKVSWSEELYRIFGLQPGRIKVQGDAMQFIHPEDRDLVMSTVQNSVKSKEPYGFYYRILRPDGDERIVHSRGHIVSDDYGNPIKVVGATQDVTERRQAEEKLKATSDQLRALSAKLNSAREEESIRIAREIHDELGSMLTSLKWDLEEIQKVLSKPVDQSQLPGVREKLTALTKLTDMSVSTLRRIASELRPSVLDDLGLAPAIEWQTQQFQARTGIICDCDCSLENLELSAEQSTAVFRIFQETLTNVLRHARATRVDIKIKIDQGFFVLSVKDNGIGISQSEKSEQQSLGLLGMRERAHLIGGEVSITSAQGQGTLITLRVPIPGREIARRMTG